MLFTRLDLAPNEKILLIVRKHWIVFLPQIITTVFFMAFPVIVYLVVLIFVPAGFLVQFLEHVYLGLFLYALWLLLLWVLFFINWTNYYLDVWYITDRRIIDINQKWIFHREISNLRFDKIQDITIEVRGVIATFLKFGDLRVQTASEDSKDFVMRNAAHPDEVRNLVFEMHNNQGSAPGNSIGGVSIKI